MANVTRCPKCNKFGTKKYGGYCKQCAPAVADCPVCGARGYPKYDDKCAKCAGVENEKVPLNRDTFFSGRGKDEPFYTDKFKCLEEGFEKEPTL